MKNNHSLSVSIKDEAMSIAITVNEDIANSIYEKYGSVYLENITMDILKEIKKTARTMLEKAFAGDTTINPTIQAERPALPEAPEPTVVEDSFFKIRKRVPNEIEKPSSKKTGKNVIDLSELEIEKAKPSNALIRCPKCGQAHCCIATTDGKSYYFLERDFKLNEFKLIGDAMDENEIETVLRKDKDKLDYFNDLQSFLSSAKENDILLSEDSALLCPCCEMSFAFKDWMETYKNPLNEFETEHLCDGCGGEMVEVRGKKTAGKKNLHTFTCETCKRTVEENENE